MKAPLVALFLLLAGCGHDDTAARGEPSRATGGLLRAVFGTRASRARLQWRNAAATPAAACRGNLARSGAVFRAMPDRAAAGTVTVARDHRREGAGGRFLRRVHDRLRAATRLSHVFGPDDDAAHQDHFHLDRGVRWRAFWS